MCSLYRSLWRLEKHPPQADRFRMAGGKQNSKSACLVRKLPQLSGCSVGADIQFLESVWPLELCSLNTKAVEKQFWVQDLGELQYGGKMDDDTGWHHCLTEDACCGIAAAESSRWWLEKAMTAASREDRAIAMNVYTYKNWAFFKAGWDGAFTYPVFNLVWHWVQAKLQVPEKIIRMKQNDITSLGGRLKGQSRENSEQACHFVAVLGFGQCVLLTLLCNLSLRGLERVLRVNKAAVTHRHSMSCPVLTPFMW